MPFSKRVCLMWLGTTVLLALSGFFASSALAGHTNHNAHCQTLCRNTWYAANTNLYVDTIDQFSSSAPWWSTAANYANASWTAAHGPQFVYFGADPNHTWVYYKYSSSGSHMLTPSALGITWNCDNNFGICRPYDDAINIKWSEIYLNASNAYMTGSGTTPANAYAVQMTFAHEMGHALGLTHHPANDHLMRPDITSTNGSLPNGPTDPGDIGNYTNPACTAPTDSRGIRCIYLWTAS